MNQASACGASIRYTYYQRGEQKSLEQTKRRGRRLSIIGLFQPLISFVYGLVIGGVNRKSYIQIMEREAQEAEKIGRIRVIVQDNGPIHRCGGSSTVLV
jgi:putative transposase